MRVFDEREDNKYCDCSHDLQKRTCELSDLEDQNRKLLLIEKRCKPLPPHIVDVNAEYEAELPGTEDLPSANKSSIKTRYLFKM